MIVYKAYNDLPFVGGQSKTAKEWAKFYGIDEAEFFEQSNHYFTRYSDETEVRVRSRPLSAYELLITKGDVGFTKEEAEEMASKIRQLIEKK